MSNKSDFGGGIGNYFIAIFIFAFFMSMSHSASAEEADLLKRCEAALAYQEGQDMTQYSTITASEIMNCSGYISGFIDLNYQYQEMLGKDALFCLPEKKLDRLDGVRFLIDYLRTHENELTEKDDYLVTAAFSTKFPCIPLMKKKK